MKNLYQSLPKCIRFSTSKVSTLLEAGQLIGRKQLYKISLQHFSENQQQLILELIPFVISTC